MPTELAVIEKAEMVPSLEELAATINADHEKIEAAIVSVIEDAANLGDLLIATRRAVPLGQWTRWCTANLTVTPQQATAYIRIATYRDICMAAPNIKAARQLLAGLPATRQPSNGMQPTFDVEHARRLRESGWSSRSIAQLLGRTESAIIRQLDPDQKRIAVLRSNKASRKRTADRKARIRQERAENAERIGGGINACMKSIRRAQQDAHNLSETGTTPEIRQAATLAYRAGIRYEDEIAKILVLG